jgi:cytochrome c peroxidase
VLPSTSFDYEMQNDFFFDNKSNGQNNTVHITNDMVTLGRVLFYDGSLSLNNSVSCGTCHEQSKGFTDGKAHSEGLRGELTKRNAMAISNVNNKFSFFWDGRATDIKEQVLMPVADHIEMGMEDKNVLPKKLAKIQYYPELFDKAFGGTEVTAERIGMALGSFMKSLKSTDAKLNLAFKIPGNGLGGNEELAGFSDLEKKGFELFNTRYNCASCHTFIGGSYYGGNSFVNIGLDALPNDLGRGNITAKANESSNDKGKFAIPSLQNIALTGPYMHDGRFNTLEEVLEHYSDNIKSTENLDVRLTQEGADAIKSNNTKPLEKFINPQTGDINTSSFHPLKMEISSDDKKAIIAFLHTLTDEKFIKDPKFSDPFNIK